MSLTFLAFHGHVTSSAVIIPHRPFPIGATWWSFGTKHLSLMVSEINGERYAMVDMTLSDL